MITGKPEGFIDKPYATALTEIVTQFYKKRTLARKSGVLEVVIIMFILKYFACCVIC
jgi:hypothetical protein